MQTDFSCNHAALAKHCHDLISRGCKGVVVFGTTGEGPSFTLEERILAIRAITELGVDPKQLIVGVSSCSYKDAAMLIKSAMDLKCLAVMAAPPFFYKPLGDEAVVSFYREAIKQSGARDVKMILYHIPQFSGVPISVNVIEALLNEFPENIAGIKESEGNFALTQEILARFPTLQVFIGNEGQIINGVGLGASGAISGICNAFPELICSLYRKGKENKETEDQKRVLSLIATLSRYPIFPAIKKLVELQKGDDWKTMRPPLAPLTSSQTKSLTDSLKALKITL